MAQNAVNVSSLPSTVPCKSASHARHGSHSKGAAGTPSKADESIEQLAQEGDPVAIAELKAETPASRSRQHSASTADGSTPASEPGKGEQVDQYA